MGLPKTIKSVRTIITSTIPASLLKDGQWIYRYRLDYIYAAWHAELHGGKLVSGKYVKDTLALAQDFLAPLADRESCRRKKIKWANPYFCPESPYGDYIWTFHIEMVEEIIALRREFLVGFADGVSKNKDKTREPPPQYRDGGSRAASWDFGYILGLAWIYHRKEIKTWERRRRCPKE
jgi:hypothetical protein